MASTERLLTNVQWAHTQYSEAEEKADGLRTVRNVAIVLAAEGGATHAEIATALEMTQQSVSSIISRTDRPAAD